ncbi:unnamed protein product [Lymnaea stagnalis]|uniref:Uncharacterized protein n=1 Tax=Lymnaea stagnalis TaxID=6523 RepID=A0AAV2HY66_LYMST
MHKISSRVWGHFIENLSDNMIIYFNLCLQTHPLTFSVVASAPKSPGGGVLVVLVASCHLKSYNFVKCEYSKFHPKRKRLNLRLIIVVKIEIQYQLSRVLPWYYVYKEIIGI